MSITEDFTSGSTLRREAKKLNIPFQQVNYKDLIKPFQNGGSIVNLSDSSASNGTHWTAVWKDKNTDIYFDSFGFKPPVEVEKLLRKPYYYNDAQIQDHRAGGCGSYSIEFLQHMNADKKLNPKVRFKKFLDQFDDEYQLNRKILKELEKY